MEGFLSYSTELTAFHNNAPLQADAAPPPELSWLKNFLDTFVMEGFLPHVWVNLRGRCTAALEDPEAFTPVAAAAPPAAAARSKANTAALLPVALFAEQVGMKLCIPFRCVVQSRWKIRTCSPLTLHPSLLSRCLLPLHGVSSSMHCH